MVLVSLSSATPSVFLHFSTTMDELPWIVPVSYTMSGWHAECNQVSLWVRHDGCNTSLYNTMAINENNTVAKKLFPRLAGCYISPSAIASAFMAVVFPILLLWLVFFFPLINTREWTPALWAPALLCSVTALRKPLVSRVPESLAGISLWILTPPRRYGQLLLTPFYWGGWRLTETLWD